MYDVTLGRSQLALDAYLQRLEGKHWVRIVCMDLASTYRTVVRKHFPNAKIVADRFHVIRLVNQHFLACWRQLDPDGSKNRGLLSLMRRHRHNLSLDQQQRLSSYLAGQPGARNDLSLQTATVLLAPQKAPYAQTLRAPGSALSASFLSTSSGRTAATGHARRHASRLV